MASSARSWSGLKLILAGVALNILGRILITLLGRSGVVLAFAEAAWMFASVVVVIFGVIRLVGGLVTRPRGSEGTNAVEETS